MKHDWPHIQVFSAGVLNYLEVKQPDFGFGRSQNSVQP